MRRKYSTDLQVLRPQGALGRCPSNVRGLFAMATSHWGGRMDGPWHTGSERLLMVAGEASGKCAAAERIPLRAGHESQFPVRYRVARVARGLKPRWPGFAPAFGIRCTCLPSNAAHGSASRVIREGSGDTRTCEGMRNLPDGECQPRASRGNNFRFFSIDGCESSDLQLP
jgi:hypothetical protein